MIITRLCLLFSLIIVGLTFFSEFARSASFDCYKARSATEKMICSDPDISKLDENMANKFKLILDQSLDKQNMIKEQRKWLKEVRNICQNTECLKNSYKDRINNLTLASAQNAIDPKTEIKLSCKDKKFPDFKEYPVPEVYKGIPHPPVLATSRDKRYKTQIKNSMEKNEASFAGHYTIAEWGCGTGCKQFVIIDMLNGVIYDPPFQTVDSHNPMMEGSEDSEWDCIGEAVSYVPKSKLLIVEGCLEGKQCGRTFFTMENGLKQIMYDPDRLNNGSIAPY